MAILNSNKALNEFFERASDAFRRLATKTPRAGQEAAFKSGLSKLGSAISEQNLQKTTSIMEQLVESGKSVKKN